MSDTTLYSSLYQQITAYAELIDEALVAFVHQRDDPRLYKRLGEMLNQLAHPAQGQLADRMVAQMILDHDTVGQSDLDMAAEAFRNGIVDEVARSTVEQLASALEQERTKAMARMHGERR
jgi:hypothetical protein